MRQIKSKKGVGAIISWVFAFTIIFFLSLLFLTLASYFSLHKRVETGQDTILTLEGEFTSIREQRELSTVLSSYFEEIPIKSFLLEEDFRSGEMKSFFENKLPGKYGFSVFGKAYRYYYRCGKFNQEYAYDYSGSLYGGDPYASYASASQYLDPLAAFYLINKAGNQKKIGFKYEGECE